MGQPVDMQGLVRDMNELLVLSTLRAEAKHGYQIALDVEADSGGTFSFQHGTLYPILHRLEADGLVRGEWSAGGGRRRKTYGLTAAGRRALEGKSATVGRALRNLIRLVDRPAPELA